MTDERGYTPEEIERGEDRPGCHLPPWGCALILLGLFALLGYLVFANGFFMHGDP